MEQFKCVPEGSIPEEIRYQRITHSPVLTMCDVGRVLNIPPHVMVKVLILEVKGTDHFVVAALPGDRRLSWKKLSKAMGIPRSDINLIDPSQIEEITGLPLGGIRPFGYDERFSVLFDRMLLTSRSVYCSAGKPTESLRIKSADLLRISRGKLADLKR